MVKDKLLKRELAESYENTLEKVKYNKDIFLKLFEECDEFGISEHYYCCYGESTSCWVEIIEEGNFDLTLEDVKRYIKRNLHEAKKYLYNGRKYGGNRLWIEERDNIIYIYIYLRDVLKVDYHMWFSKGEMK